MWPLRDSVLKQSHVAGGGDCRSPVLPCVFIIACPGGPFVALIGSGCIRRAQRLPLCVVIVSLACDHGSEAVEASSDAWRPGGVARVAEVATTSHGRLVCAWARAPKSVALLRRSAQVEEDHHRSLPTAVAK